MKIDIIAGEFLKEVAKRKRGRFAYIIIKERSLEFIKELIKKAHFKPEAIIIKEGKINVKEVELLK